MSRRAIRIANVSGFYGDQHDAMREMVTQGDPVDVVTGDYLAELTMLILWKARRRDPSAGYARTFLTQLETVLGACLDRGTKIVVNAGGLNPSGLADQVRELGERLGLHPRVAQVRGDDLMGQLEHLRRQGVPLTHLDTGESLTGEPVTANAYLGGWGITEALAGDADIVLTGRVTDASLVTGPAAWWHGWHTDDFDALAGAVAAGHVIECGPQACGGNYPFIDELPDHRYPGFPIAEVASDGSSVITKQPGTGGLVSVGTVTAQLLYEIGDPAYLNPDVTARFDSTVLEQVGPDRVLMSGTCGHAPTDSLKVAINLEGGYRNTVTMVITGLDINKKADFAVDQLFERVGGREQFDRVDVDLVRHDHRDADRNAEATAHLRISVASADEARVGRAFSNVATAMAVASYPGLHTTHPPAPASAYGVYWPALVPRDQVTHEVVLPDGGVRTIPDPPLTAAPVHHGDTDQTPPAHGPVASGSQARTRLLPLGRLVGGRSGDKGGNANVGLWARDDAAFAWLDQNLDVAAFRRLLPEADDLPIRRYRLANLRALNFVVVGWLGEGVSSCTRPDPQAKGLAEYIRSRTLAIPVDLVRE